MNLWISLGDVSKKEWKKDDQFRLFIKEWTDRGNTVAKIINKDALQQLCLQLRSGLMQEREHILLSDREEDLKIAGKTNMCLCGYGPAASLPSARVVFENSAALSARFLEMQAHHVFEKPYVIGSREGITLRESVVTDFDPLYSIFQEAGLPMFHMDGSEEEVGLFGPLEHEKESSQPNMGEDRPLDRERKMNPEERKTGPLRQRLGLNPRKLAMRAAFYRYIKDQYRFFGYGLWTVLDTENKVSGWCGFNSTSEHPDLGYIIRQDHQRRGLGYTASCIAIDFARDEMELERISLFASKDNLPSLGLAGKLGFKNVAESPDGCMEYVKLLS